MTRHVQSFFELVSRVKRRIRQVGADEAAALMRAGAVVLDVRDEEEFGRGHIEGAMQVDGESLGERIRELVSGEDASIVCYCSRGYRAALAVDALQRLGYRNVVSIEGGLRAYLQAAEKVGT